LRIDSILLYQSLFEFTGPDSLNASEFNWPFAWRKSTSPTFGATDPTAIFWTTDCLQNSTVLADLSDTLDHDTSSFEAIHIDSSGAISGGTTLSDTNRADHP